MELSHDAHLENLEPERTVRRWVGSNGRIGWGLDSGTASGSESLPSSWDPAAAHPLQRYLNEAHSHELVALGLSSSLADGFIGIDLFKKDASSPPKSWYDVVLVRHPPTESSWSVVVDDGDEQPDAMDRFINSVESHEKLAFDLCQDPPAGTEAKPAASQRQSASPPSSICLSPPKSGGEMIEPDPELNELSGLLVDAGMGPLGPWKRPRSDDRPRVQKKTQMRSQADRKVKRVKTKHNGSTPAAESPQ